MASTDPNSGAKVVLGAVVTAASFAGSMVAELQVTGSTALRRSQVLLEVIQEVVDATPGADMLATGMAMAPIIAPVIGAAISSATKTCLRRRAAGTSKSEEASNDTDQAEASPISKREDVSPLITHEEIRGTLQQDEEDDDKFCIMAISPSGRDQQRVDNPATAYHKIHDNNAPTMNRGQLT